MIPLKNLTQHSPPSKISRIKVPSSRDLIACNGVLSPGATSNYVSSLTKGAVMPAFSTLYLQASDLPDNEDTIVTIREFERKEMRQDDKTVMKWVLYFVEIEAGLALNDTNGRAICRSLGKEMNEWKGKKISLYVHPGVEYNGMYLRGIRVR